MASNKKQTGFALIPVIIFVILFLGGVALLTAYVAKNQKAKYKNQASSSTDSSSQSPTTNIEDSIKNDLKNIKSIAQIKTIAADEIGSASIISIEFIEENQKLVYILTLSDKRVLKYNAQTGELLSTTLYSGTQILSKDNSIPSDFTPSITLKNARTSAIEEWSDPTGKKVASVTLIKMDDDIAYRVKFTDEGVVYISATTGAILGLDVPPVKDDSADEN